MFALSGATQVCAKAFTSLALASGVSFPVVTLAKSGKPIDFLQILNYVLIRRENGTCNDWVSTIGRGKIYST